MDDLIDRGVVKRELNAQYAVAKNTANPDAVEQILRAVSKFFDSFPAVNRWIPVEDALPEIGYNVLVTRQTESNARYTRIASRQDDCWMDSTDEYGKPNPHPVIAWMPMPDTYEPPKE